MIIAKCNGFELTENNGFYAFYSTESNRCPVNQCGTLEEVKAELQRWKNEIDFNNHFMMEVENCFIAALSQYRR